MRAVVVREHGPLARHRLETLPDPAPGRGEVLIEARAIGVNFPDLMVMQGSYQLLPPRPFSPGKEVAGVVGAIGEGVTRVRVGDHAMALPEYGAYAEKVVVSEAHCFRMPDRMPFDEGAVLALAYQTAHFALLERGAYREGESVLVTGASGGVGLAAVQLAKAFGATVIAGVTSKEKGELCRRHGADHVVDLAAPELRGALRAQLQAALGTRGVDIVLDNVGGEVFDAALRALAWRGRMVTIGFASGRIPEVKAGYLLVKNVSVSGLQWTDYRAREPERVLQVQDELYALYGAGKLKPEITARYPLGDFAEALARFESRQVQGKIVLLP